MRNIIFAFGGVPGVVIRQTGDFPHQQVHIPIHRPHAGDCFPVGQLAALRHHFGLVCRIVDDFHSLRAVLAQPHLHAALHRGILAQNDAAAGDFSPFQQLQQVGNIIAAVGGLRFQRIGITTFLPPPKSRVIFFPLPAYPWCRGEVL